MLMYGTLNCCSFMLKTNENCCDTFVNGISMFTPGHGRHVIFGMKTWLLTLETVYPS